MIRFCEMQTRIAEVERFANSNLYSRRECDFLSKKSKGDSWQIRRRRKRKVVEIRQISNCAERSKVHLEFSTASTSPCCPTSTTSQPSYSHLTTRTQAAEHERYRPLFAPTVQGTANPGQLLQLQRPPPHSTAGGGKASRMGRRD